MCTCAHECVYMSEELSISLLGAYVELRGHCLSLLSTWLRTGTLLFFIAYTSLAGLGAAVESPASISRLAVEGLASQM